MGSVEELSTLSRPNRKMRNVEALDGVGRLNGRVAKI
jgi:hypothetical protein